MKPIKLVEEIQYLPEYGLDIHLLRFHARFVRVVSGPRGKRVYSIRSVISAVGSPIYEVLRG